MGLLKPLKAKYSRARLIMTRAQTARFENVVD